MERVLKRDFRPIAAVPAAPATSAKLMQEQFVVMARAGMARQDKTPAVGSRQMDVDHLDG